MANKQAGGLSSGYDCSFVDPPSGDLQVECSVCLHVLREPCLVSCCGYRFCRACIEPIQKGDGWSTGGKCPLCKESFTSLLDKQLARTLKGKAVYCTHKDTGCDWKGKLGLLDSHLSPSTKEGCKFVTIKCRDCNEEIFRFAIKQHAQVCTSMIKITKLERDNSLLKEQNSCLREQDSLLKGQIFRLREQLRVKEDEMRKLRVEFEAMERKFNVLTAKETTRLLKVTNLPPGTNKHNIQSIFGQHGTVEDVKMNFFGQHSAMVTFCFEENVERCLSYSERRGINLKCCRLCVDPEPEQEYCYML